LASAGWSRRMPAGEGMQAGQVVAFSCGDPRGQALVVAAGHHLGEGGDVAGGAFSCGLRALIFASLAVSPSVRWPGWLVIHRVTSPDGRPGQRGDAAAWPAGLPIGGFRGGIR
jgi:hypothetical protein